MMREPVQARPVFRAFMRKVVGRRWIPADEPAATSPKRGRGRKASSESRGAGRYLIQLTTFATPRGRGPFARRA